MPATIKKSEVEFVRLEVIAMLEKWERIRAAVGGEDEIKKLGDKVVPRPNPGDISPENRKRYDGYIQRAVWYNVSARTLNGMAGYVFAKEPVVELPATLKPIAENVDGSGVTIHQQAEQALRLMLALGRAGLLVDYPATAEATSRQQLIDGKISPTIVLYEPDQIVNWRTATRGAQIILELLVLRETVVVPSKSEFELESVTQYRVLTLKDGAVLGRIFSKQANGEFDEEKAKAYEPKDNTGKAFSEIPFVFLGAVNNDSGIDTPPLLDLVNLNVAHFRNSADYEESCFLVGQPTPWISGLTEMWVKEVLKGQIHLGSRAVIPLPAGGQAGLLQAQPNTLPMEAMKHKEEQMVGIGAKLIEQKEVQKTATEATMDHAADVSTLTSAATNMFLGYKQALEFCGRFVGDKEAKITYELTEPLVQQVITPEQATSLTSLWQGGLIDFEEARYALKKGGVAWKEDDEVKTAVENEGLPPNPNDPAPKPGEPKPPTPPPAE